MVGDIGFAVVIVSRLVTYLTRAPAQPQGGGRACLSLRLAALRLVGGLTLIVTLPVLFLVLYSVVQLPTVEAEIASVASGAIIALAVTKYADYGIRNAS